uniref:Uncharacterized protein n=1 Tax=viral metagenome TaxID=1070528 RepID=A0A6C0AJI3_9ZZZZ
MLKARDVIQEQENQRERRMSAMRPVLSQIYAQIKKQAIHSTDVPYTIFEVPKFVFGYPLFKIAEAREYLINVLSESGFAVWPVNNDYLLISWTKQQMNRGRPSLLTNYRPMPYDPLTLASMNMNMNN